MGKNTAIALFLIALVVAAMFGLARDFYSREGAVVKGTIVETDAGGAASKAQPLRGPTAKAKLSDGSIVDVAVTGTSGLNDGQAIDIREMIMPWGQVWYKLAK